MTAEPTTPRNRDRISIQRIGVFAYHGVYEEEGRLGYSPLGQGYLTGKYRDGAMPEGSRKKMFQRLNRYEGVGADAAINAYLDLAAAGQADDLEKSVSYADIAAQVQEIAVGNRYNIIEALAEAIAGELMRNFPRIDEIAVTIEKPNAAVAAILDSIFVTINRSRAR